MHGSLIQLCSWMLVFIALYAMGYRGWGLFLLAFFGGVALTVALGAPLDRVIPRRLEPYEAPFWARSSEGTRGKSVLGLSDGENATGDSQKIEPSDQSEPRSPRTS
jgi:hypothetical protein